ncbi:hypothetical protein AB0M20_27510 [Actinoplanes sp. NPDC051633]|uniref:hypothetical protein n=1 Tax=Actinoplanes sp. NPDC051633 TaxID=3155670 RepID=UPI0034274723
MIVVMLLTLVLGAMIVFAVWCVLRDGAGRRSGAHAEPRPERAEPSPGSLEGVLVTQLTQGEITRGQYRRAMTLIAAREEERRPMPVPTDD